MADYTNLLSALQGLLDPGEGDDPDHALSHIIEYHNSYDFTQVGISRQRALEQLQNPGQIAANQALGNLMNILGNYGYANVPMTYSYSYTGADGQVHTASGYVGGAQPGTTALANLFAQMLGQVYANPHEDVKVVLKEDAFNALNKLKFKDYNGDTDKCTVCLDEYQADDDIVLTPCNHPFHVNCIKDWLLKFSHLCPLCKTSCGEHAPLNT